MFKKRLFALPTISGLSTRYIFLYFLKKLSFYTFTLNLTFSERETVVEGWKDALFYQNPTNLLYFHSNFFPRCKDSFSLVKG